MDTVLEEMRQIISDILDIEIEDIKPDTCLVKDLGAESIDLLELSIALGSRFDIKVDEDSMFLKKIAFYKREAEEQGKDTLSHIGKKYPFLSKDEIKKLLPDIKGFVSPVRIQDLVSYVLWKQGTEQIGN